MMTNRDKLVRSVKCDFRLLGSFHLEAMGLSVIYNPEVLSNGNERTLHDFKGPRHEDDLIVLCPSSRRGPINGNSILYAAHLRSTAHTPRAERLALSEAMDNHFFPGKCMLTVPDHTG